MREAKWTLITMSEEMNMSKKRLALWMHHFNIKTEHKIGYHYAYTDEQFELIKRIHTLLAEGYQRKEIAKIIQHEN